jgi:Family of unknown function (DUF5691)
VSTWQDLVTASLIGTERSAVPPVAVPGVPTPADAPADPAAILLDRAALLTVARRGGRLAEHADPLPAAEPDRAATVSPAAGRRLARMLSGEHPDLLAEWLSAAVTRGRRVPAHLLPALLDRARRVSSADQELRRLAALAGGSRAGWLAGLNRDWAFVAAHTRPGDDAWRLGDAGQRRGYLAALRARDPDAARELIAASWDAAGPERVMFLSVLADRLSPADEPLLEAALGDRAQDVRGWAAYLLASLPRSALGQRMAERARGCMRMERDIRGTRLVTIPPAECDAAMRRDGITPRPGGGGLPLDDRNHLMLEVVARTPLLTWSNEFGRSAEQILAVPSGAWEPVLFAGWSRAAMAQRDQEWMAALINRALADGPPGRLVGAEILRQLVRRVDPALVASETTARRDAGPAPAIHDAITVLRFRHDMLKELDVDHSDG